MDGLRTDVARLTNRVHAQESSIDLISHQVAEQETKYDTDFEAVQQELANLNTAIPNHETEIAKQSGRLDDTIDSVVAIEERLQPALRQVNENKIKIATYAPLEQSNMDMNEDLFEKLGIINLSLVDLDSEVQKFTGDMRRENGEIRKDVSRLQVDQATIGENLNDVTGSMDALVQSIRQDSTRLEQLDSNVAVIHKKHLEAEMALNSLNSFARVTVSTQMGELQQEFVTQQQKIENLKDENSQKMLQMKLALSTDINQTQILVSEKCEELEEAIEFKLQHEVTKLEIFATNLNNVTASKISKDFEDFTQGLVDFTNDIKNSVTDNNEQIADLKIDVENLENVTTQNIQGINSQVTAKSIDVTKKYGDLEQRHHTAENEMHAVKS